MIHGKWFKAWMMAVLAGMWACADEGYDDDMLANGNGAGTIGFMSDPMQAYQVKSRASDAKDDDEKRINYLHIFFFDEDGEYLTGSYLTGYPDATAKKSGGYYAAGEGVTVLKIANETEHFTDEDKARRAVVYAVANVDASFFRELDEDGRPSVVSELAATAGISPRAALERLTYSPGEGISLGVPRAGMPMAGYKQIDLTKEEETVEGERIVELKALMARVDVNISLASEVSEGNLPSMTLVEWTAKNLPMRVRFGELAADSTTGVGWEDWGEGENPKDITTPLQRTIYNRNGEISFSFYMFENVQAKSDDYTYPSDAYNPDLGIDKRQNYKPWIGADTANSAAVELHAFYSTYNDDGTGSATYEVWYTLYLGANHTDNFEVKRNHQYKNDITITGLTAQAAVEDGKYTFDARVNIDEEANDFYIAMLRERNHDAHFCVTPMDVYMFADESKQPTVEVSLDASADQNGQPWIRMEKIAAADMEAGTVAVSGFTGGTNGTHLETGTPWTAGNGKRRYFTTDLVTNTLAESGKVVTIENSRDRVYFYIDENLSDSQDRTATVTLIYKENGNEIRRRTLDITQTHFLKVQVYGRDENRPDYNNPYPAEDGGVIYMEQYEEYLDHYDPLDEYATEQVYAGLEWGLDGERVATGLFDSGQNNYVEGLAYTNEIVSEASQTIMNLNGTPRSAAEYCYNRNKRQTDGSILDGSRISWTPSRFEPDHQKYFLPGIRQMEDALTQYYQTFTEFQDNFYWSSAAGKGWSSLLAPQDEHRARATKVNADGSYVESAYGDNYPDGGATPRVGVPLRIRAFRIDLESLEEN